VLAVVSFPVFDPRDLLSPNSERLRKPSWPAPSATSPQHFMRKFGRVYERSKGGLSGFYAEQRVCDASRALRFHNLTRFKATGFAALTTQSFQPRIRQRHFFFDGRCTGKFEIGFEIPKGWNHEATVRRALPTVVAHLLGQRVVVGEASEHPLLEAGPAIASLYQQSSTWRPKGAPPVVNRGPHSLCRAGTPLVTITVAASSREVVVPSNARSTTIGNCSLISWRVIDLVPYFVMAIIEAGRRNTDLARNLRLFTTRVHAELATIELGLDTLDRLLNNARDQDEREQIAGQFGERLGDGIGRLESILNRIGRSTLALAGSSGPGSTRDVGAAVLHELWPGRLDFVADRYDVIVRKALRNTPLQRGPLFWLFKLKRDPRIFISYRRADTGSDVDELERLLRKRLPEANVFRDVASMAPGDQWRERVRAALIKSDIVIVMMGSAWMGPDTIFGRRIDDEEDVMRCEIEIALEHGKRIVPVIAPDGSPPDAATLPGTLAPLCEYQAYAVSADDREGSLERLVARVLN